MSKKLLTETKTATSSRIKPTSEEGESKMFVQWLNLMSLPHHHSANEVPLKKIVGTRPDGRPLWDNNWSMMRKLKEMGVSKGFPDYIVIIPKERAKLGRSLMIAIEMKRERGGTTSPEQKQWIKYISEISDCEGFICKGFNEAKAVVKQFIS